MNAWCYVSMIGSGVVVLAVLVLAVRCFRQVVARQRAITALLCD
jgi:hypothetical protein